MKAKHKPEYQQMLSDTFDFTDQDLAANQQGVISPRQVELLQRKRRHSGLITLFSAVVLIIMGGIGLMFVLLLPPFGVILMLFLIYAGYQVWKRWSALERDLREGLVAQVEGLINLDIRQSTRTTGTSSRQRYETVIRYFVRVGNIKLRVDRPMFFAFKNGDPYRIYYLPRYKHIVSVEWLNARADNPFME